MNLIIMCFIGACAIGIPLLWRAFFIEPQALQVTNHRITIRAFDSEVPIRLVHLTDLHLWDFGDRERRLLAKVARVQPDIIVLTGDYAESDDGLLALATLLSELSRHAPIYAILGDNDLEDRAWEKRLMDVFHGRQITVLRNDAKYVEHNGQGIVIAGVDDPNTGYARIDLIRARAEALPNVASRQSLASIPVLVLAHSPEIVLDVEPWMDLVLTGHTHGGQICLPGGRAMYTNTPACRGFASGWYTVCEETRLYVNRGVGTARIPARLFCPSEIAVFDLLGNDAVHP